MCSSDLSTRILDALGPANQMLEPRALYLAGPRASKILVDYLDLLEAKLASVVGQAILSALAFLVVNHLPRR